MKSKRVTQRYIVIKMTRVKEKNLKGSKRKTATYKGTPLKYPLLLQQKLFVGKKGVTVYI